MKFERSTGVRCVSLFVLNMATAILVACGGSEAPEAKLVETTVRGSRADQAGSNPGPAASASEKAVLARGAQLNQATLAQAELQSLVPGAITPKSAYLSGEVARKAAALRIPAYRFYNASTGAHFYTTDETERARVASTLSPPFSYDGPAFSVASAHSAGLSSVHRFYNTRTGVHFYTISEEERASVAARLPHFTYEGVSYYASQVAGAGLVPLYRFYVHSRGFHFYTASEAEKTRIERDLSATYTLEGIGYYVLDTGWNARERLPHTGITTNQCYQAGSNTLVACSSAGALGLNPQQDGHRTAIAPMSYSREPSLFGPYPITSCVRDNVTGLVWEGKEAAGQRAGSNTYTHLGTNAATDTSGYVAAVNVLELCGYTDWRLPTRNELLTIVDYGRSAVPTLNTTWFPNTATNHYWSANVLSTNSTFAWHVDFSAETAKSSMEARSNSRSLRLVRGSLPTGPRFSFSSLGYAGDATNNVVNDALTGLQWRRCEEGSLWNGSTCSDSSSLISHEEALVRARQQTGWRLPNITELASLSDLAVSSGTSIDLTAFPGAIAARLWSSSPRVVNPNYAWAVNFRSGVVDGGVDEFRTHLAFVRLVHTSP